jgi:aminoglycoside 3-N-acetyltransferase I
MTNTNLKSVDDHYTYKQVSASDLPLMKALLAVFGEAFGEPNTYLGAVPSDAYLEALLKKPHFIALAALRDDEVVGGLAAYELEKFEQARSEIYVYDRAVQEAQRMRRTSAFSSDNVALGRRRQEWPRFQPPADRGAVTVADVLAAGEGGSNEALQRWAASVWGAWRDQHEAVADLVRRRFDKPTQGGA